VEFKMVNLLTWYRQNKEKKTALKFANELAFHIHSVFIYLLEQNRTLQSGSCIKEAIGLLDNWRMVSENLYEHKPTGLALEVRPESKLLSITKAVLDVELDAILVHNQGVARNEIIKQAHFLVEDYFEKNSFVDKIRL